jgi:hypothetical protein
VTATDIAFCIFLPVETEGHAAFREDEMKQVDRALSPFAAVQQGICHCVWAL